MTEKEWVDLTIANVNYSPRISERTAKQFNKLLQSNSKFRQQARSFFGDRNIYHAEDYAVQSFVFATLGTIRERAGTSTVATKTWNELERNRKR